MPSPVDFTITPETLQNVKEVRGFFVFYFKCNSCVILSESKRRMIKCCPADNQHSPLTFSPYLLL